MNRTGLDKKLGHKTNMIKSSLYHTIQKKKNIKSLDPDLQ